MKETRVADSHKRTGLPGSIQDISPLISHTLLNQLWEDLLTKHGRYSCKIVSDSMRPLIKEGEQIFVKRAYQDEIHFGDIIVFKRARQLIVHRVIGKRVIGKKTYFIEKGDATLQSSLVPASSIIGKVLVVSKSKGNIYISSRWGRSIQKILGYVSCFSLGLWIPIERVNSLFRHISCSRYCLSTYCRFFTLSRTLIVSFLPYRKQLEF